MCREDEIQNIDKIIDNLTQLKQKAITIKFGHIIRFDNGSGVMLPAISDNDDFHELRRNILNGIIANIRRHDPHITLMHPRNSKCTDEIFESFLNEKLPTQITFRNISLIEQHNGEQWKTIRKFDLL